MKKITEKTKTELAHQPEDDEKCYAHLCKAVEDVSDAIS